MEDDLGEALVKDKDIVDEQEQQKLQAMEPGIMDHGACAFAERPFA
jgi:hypothetical protein